MIFIAVVIIVMQSFMYPNIDKIKCGWLADRQAGRQMNTTILNPVVSPEVEGGQIQHSLVTVL